MGRSERLSRLLIDRLPIACLPPYGKSRTEFFKFLQGIPEGGIGFHSTTETGTVAISREGLQKEHCEPSEITGERSVHCYYLDPSTDVVLARTNPGLSGKIITYHRLLNTLEDTMVYGIAKAKFARLDNLNPDELPTPVVFRNVAPYIPENDDGVQNPSSFPDHVHDYKTDVEVTRDQIRERRFLFRDKHGFRHHLSWARTDSIPVENIVGVYTMGEGEKVPRFARRVRLKLTEMFAG